MIVRGNKKRRNCNTVKQTASKFKSQIWLNFWAKFNIFWKEINTSLGSTGSEIGPIHFELNAVVVYVSFILLSPYCWRT